jgi:uncharacterized protein YlaI
MIAICDKCKIEKEIHEHHTWCKVLNNPHGFAWDNVPSRVWLCKPCHDKIELDIIIPILKQYSTKPNYNTEYYLWKFISEDKHKEVIEKVVKESWRWIHGDS